MTGPSPSSPSETPSLAARSAHTSLKRTRILFDVNPFATFIPTTDPTIAEASIQRRKRRSQPPVAQQRQHQNEPSNALAIISTEPNSSSGNASSTTLTIHRDADSTSDGKPSGILVKSSKNKSASVKIPTPTWHAPWKLSTVLSSHLGWVRSIAMDPTNDMFATGSADRTIKIWDLAKASVGAADALKLTLTGHISPVRGLAFSERHPYLFSCAEDKQVRCWDLETNQVIRHYHGHLSGVFCLALHPTLDILVTGGRDAVARVWDMRERAQIHCLSGHEHTVASLLTKSTDPQIVTGSHDMTVKMWDLAAGKCMTTLTHHQKAIRALAQPSFEHTFVSGAADCLKYWQGKDGRFLKSYTTASTEQRNSVVNCLAVNDDGVLVSGGDDGSMQFWDYKTGQNFQSSTSIVQPGSLDAENGIFASQFDHTGTRLITGEADKTIKEAGIPHNFATRLDRLKTSLRVKDLEAR